MELKARQARRGPWFQIGAVREFEWNCYDLAIDSLPPALEGLRIVHISDLHLKSAWPAALDEVMDRLSQSPPDLILFTGDFVDSKVDHRPALPHVRRLVTGLKSRLGCFAILGNHDGHLIAPRLAGWGVHLIEEQRVCLRSRHATIELLGLPGFHRDELTRELIGSVPGRKPETLRIVLSHYPDHFRYIQAWKPDLYLAGHTHGGQICLPGGVPIVRHDSLPRRLCKGVHQIGGTWLIVNRGMGYSNYPLRVFCPAEVIELKLTRTVGSCSLEREP